MADIFDRLTEEKEDVFDDVEQEDSAVENIKKSVAAVLEKFDSKERRNDSRKLSDEIKEFIREEVAKIKPRQNVIERTIEKRVIEPKVFHVEPKVIEAPPQIIKEVRVEVQTEKKDSKKYVEESKYLDLLVKISKLEKQLQETRRMAESPVVYGGAGVIGIPPPEPNPDGHVLTVSKGKAAWAASSGGASISGYTVNNGNTLKTFDVTDTTLDEVARVLGSIISDLQA